MSIRGRMTLWYVALLACILAIFGVALYSALAYSLRAEVDRSITARAQEVSRAISEVLAARADPRTFFLQGRIILPSIDVFASPGIYVQVLTSNGQLITKSGNLGDQRLPLSATDFDVISKGASLSPKTILVGRVSLRVTSVPINLGELTIGIVQVGRSLQEVEDTLSQLGFLLVSGSLLGLVIATGIGSLLARRALAPIDTVTRTARSIVDAQGLSRRLSCAGPADEVGRLVTTFNRMLERIEELFRLQQRFTADISHELRTPLTTIRGYLDLLRRPEVQGNPGERAEIAAAAQGEIERMTRLLADLLLLAQADVGVTLEKRPVELDTLLLEIYRQAKALAKDAQVKLGHEDQALVLGDPDRLKQLLLNLVDNALKYTPAGGQVTLGLEREDKWAKVIVADTGIGIPPEDLPRIFERFYRVDKARSREQGGTGLGLSIAQWIARSHGGRIEVASTLGAGSTFTVWLPLAPAT